MQFNDLSHRRQRVPSYAQSEVTASGSCGWPLGTIENIVLENPHNSPGNEAQTVSTKSFFCVWPYCWSAIIRSHSFLTRQRKRHQLYVRCRSLISRNLASQRHCRVLVCSKLSRQPYCLTNRKNHLRKCHVHYHKSDISDGCSGQCPLLDTPDEAQSECDRRELTLFPGIYPTQEEKLSTSSFFIAQQAQVLPAKADCRSLDSKEYPGPLSMDVWIPPINSKTLHELTVPDIFNSAQFRHDVIFDPNLTFRANLDGRSGKLKRRRADRYWRMVDLAINTDRIFSASPTRFEYLHVIINELTEILCHLLPAISIAGVSHKAIDKKIIRRTLDSDLIIQQLQHDALDAQEIARFLYSTFSTACFPSRLPLVLYMQELFNNQHYGKAIKQCFVILEVIKLDIANQALRQYRMYLVETCVDFELQHFLRQHARSQVQLYSIRDWFQASWQREGKHKSFLEVYHSALVRLVTDDEETRVAMNLQPVSFPATLHLDEYRMTNQFRNEYQNIIVTAILLLPFHNIAGKYSTKEDLLNLKSTISILLKKVIEVNRTDLTFDRVSSFDLVLEVCATAIRIRQRNQRFGAMLSAEDAITQNTAAFWCQWLGHNLRPSSNIYRLMYHRVGNLLSLLSRSQVIESSEFERLCMQGLESDIRHLGGKLALVADINLRTYHTLYASILKQLTQSRFLIKSNQ